MQKFYESNLVTDFICNLLYLYWLPTYETVKAGDYILKDEFYAFNSGIIKCTQSGYIGGKYFQTKALQEYLSILRPSKTDEATGDYIYSYSNLTGGIIKFFRIPQENVKVNLINENENIYTIIGDGKTTIYNWYKLTEQIKDIILNTEILDPEKYSYNYDSENLCATIIFNIELTNSDIVYVKTTNDDLIRLFIINKLSTYLLYLPTKHLNEVNTYKETTLDSLKFFAKFEVIQPYSFGDRFRKFTDNYIANESFYSTKLHERLGKFVLVYSDLIGTDLRPYYNFNSLKYIDNIYINRTLDEDTKKIKFTVLDETTNNKILIFPVRFNHTYTIALDSPVGVTIAPMFYTKERKLLLSNGTDIDTDVSQEFIDNSNNVYYFSSMSVSNPQYVEFKCVGSLAELYYKYHKDLYMLIQMSHVVNTSVTVLEGAYKNINVEKVVEVTKLNNLSEYSINKLLTSKLTLLLLNTKTSYPFSDRLLEYLFDCVIDYTWKLDSNIEKALSLLTNGRVDDKMLGIWDNISRYRFYDYSMNRTDLKHIDINGNIDKDTEKGLIKSTLNMNGDF